MPRAKSNGIELEYDTFGRETDPPLLLIMGFSAQMTAWDEAFCRLIADEGFHVIRFDNRDVGHSSKIEGKRRANVWAAAVGDKRSASYLLDDMEKAGLLERQAESQMAHDVRCHHQLEAVDAWQQMLLDVSHPFLLRRRLV